MFKDNYQQEMNQITPDPAFLQQLAKQMEAEQDLETVRRPKRNLTWVPIAAAAVLCIGFAMMWSGNGTGKEDENYMTQNAGVLTEQETEGETVFDGTSWYGEETEAKVIYKLMLQKMTSSDRVVLMESDSNAFVTAHEISPTKQEALIDRLQKGVQAEDMTSESLLDMEATYYLAEFSDGVVIKFAIYDETYFYCSEFEGIFRL